MATGFCDPNGDVSIGWEYPDSGTHYDDIDDGVRQPTAPGTATYIMEESTFTYVTDIFDMTTLAGVSAVSQVKVWAYGKAEGESPDGKVNINIGGGWKTTTSFNFTDSNSWKSVAFNGDWTQEDLDALKVALIANLGGEEGIVIIYEMYAEITYEEEVGGEARTATLNPLGLRRFGGF